MPHAGDLHNTHKGTHQLAVEVAVEYSRHIRDKRLLLLETEYWHPMAHDKASNFRAHFQFLKERLWHTHANYQNILL